MRSLLYALLFALIFTFASVLLLVSPLGRHLEENFGLALLFKLRGPLPAPAKTIIVNIDHESSAQLQLAGDYRDWPRTVYADLIEKLTSYDAAVIVFDLHFQAPKLAEDDQRFARSISQAGNVILFEKLVRRTSGSAEDDSNAPVDLEVLIPPIPMLADASLALAPFPIPKIPVRINQAWTFKTSAGDIPTLPVVALQALARDRYDQFYDYLTRRIPEVAGTIPFTETEVRNKYGLVQTMQLLRETIYRISSAGGTVDSGGELYLADSELSDRDRQIFEALHKTYASDNNIYINFYGPPATLTTYSLHQILSADNSAELELRKSLQGAVVFVGAARTTWSEQKDGFFTVFSQDDGLDLSGVELAATVFANLLDSCPLKPLSVFFSILLLLILSLSCCLVCFLLNPIPALAVLSLIGAGGLYLARHVFALYGTWPPVIIALVLLPLASFLSALLFKYIKTRREQNHIKKALKLYLPGIVVEEISRDLSFIKTGDRMVYGVCLFTDAQDYTTLSENLSPIELSLLMKKYFEHMFKRVKQHEGLICNVIGDAMFALWPSTEPQPQMKLKACSAALDILTEIDLFNQENPGRTLPTRIGLHSGYLLMGNIGAEGHYEYAPVGDIVNTASRIELLNKRLGTWMLASEETIQGCTGFSIRLMGSFLMGGKSNPVTLYQVLSSSGIRVESLRVHQELFPEALYLFQKRQWQQAEAALRECLRLDDQDGPAKFYLELCSSYAQNPPDETWQGVIALGK